MKLKEALETLKEKRFSTSYKVNSYHWELTIYKDDNEILEEHFSTELGFLLGKYLNQKVDNNYSNELIFIQDNYRTDDGGLDVYMEYNNENKKGYIHIETEYSEQEIELNSFDDFINKMVDMENIIDKFIDVDIENREYKKVI